MCGFVSMSTSSAHRPRQRPHAILIVNVGVVPGTLSCWGCHHRPQCHHQPPNSNSVAFLRIEKVQLLTPFSNPTFSPFLSPEAKSPSWHLQQCLCHITHRLQRQECVTWQKVLTKTFSFLFLYSRNIKI